MKGLRIMATSHNTLLSNMCAAGVPLSDARWYHAIAKPRNFSVEGDAQRAQRIMKDFYRRMRSKRAHSLRAQRGQVDSSNQQVA